MDSMLAPSPWGRVPQHRQGRQPGLERRSQCNCRNSRCLKLYCECFASGQYCFGCNCQGCHNNPENNDKRVKAIEITLERNPSAFRPKIAPETSNHIDAGRHSKGCHCKKSGCLKKYCECFQAGIVCMASCKCSECKNQPGNDERLALERAGKLPLPTAKNTEGEEDGREGASSSAAAPEPAIQITHFIPPGPNAAERARAGIASYVTEGWLASACHEMLREGMRDGSRRNRLDGSSADAEHGVLSVLHSKLQELVDVADASSLANRNGTQARRDGDGGVGRGKRKAT